MKPRRHDPPRTLDGGVWLYAIILMMPCLLGGMASRVTAQEGTHAAGEVGSGHWMTGAPAPAARTGVVAAALDGHSYVLSGGPRPGSSYGRLNEMFIPPSPASPIRSGRTPAAHIGSIMALLATFHEAGVLPPESSREADRLIHALIQSQSLFLNTRDPVVRDVFVSALSDKFGAKKAAALNQAFAVTGWTSETLEALVDPAVSRSMTDEPRMAVVFREHNVTTADWKFVGQIFAKARKELLKQGKLVHAVFAVQRASMPGARQDVR